MFNRKILLIFAILCVTCLNADATDLKQVDVSKSSDNALDVTLYTTGSSVNPMVTRKANNTYVILMPSVAGKNAGAPDLGAVKDMVTDVNIKNVDDGMNGYTKITFTTTKPLNINTHLKRTTPITQEEKAAKTVIANVQTAVKSANKPSETKKNIVNDVPTPTKEVKKNIVNNFTTQTKEVKKTEKSVLAPVVKAENIIKKTESKTENVRMEKTPVKPVVEAELPKNVERPVLHDTSVNNVKQNPQPLKHHRIRHLLLMGCLSLLGLGFVAKTIKNMFNYKNFKLADLQENSSEDVSSDKQYDGIINNKDMSWQEKYKQFSSKTDDKDNKYTFVTRNLAYNKTDEKRLEFERTLDKVPEIYQHQPEELTEDKANEVSMEESSISEEMNSFKLKSFATPISLNTSRRNQYKKVLPKTTPIKEGKFVQLRDSALNRTSRKFNDANLSVSELIDKGNKFIDEKTVLNSNYSMASVEDYFNLLDKNPDKNDTASVSNKVAEDLRHIKPSMDMSVSTVKKSINPILDKRQAKDYLNGLIIKAGYNIDEHKSFHLVSLDGQNALIGRVDDNIFVLKKFNKEVANLQVRPDKDNMYLVKAGDFKSMIDVDNNKMGVLIEL